MASTIGDSSKIDVFISHSSQDVKIAEALIDLLRSALNIPPERIRCTSAEGYRLPLGADSDEQLRAEVLNAKTFIILITESSLKSIYVLFELGARWGASLQIAPVLTAGSDPSILRGPLASFNALSCDIPAQVHQIVTDIASLVGKESASPSAYQKQLDALVRESKEASVAKLGLNSSVKVTSVLSAML